MDDEHEAAAERATQGRPEAAAAAGDEPSPPDERPRARRARGPKRPRGRSGGAAPATDGAPGKRAWLRKAGSWALQLALLAAVLWGITRWQARRLLSSESPAPAFSLQALDGSAHELPDARGRKVVLYFFAPWCTVCSYSSHNINALRQARSGDDLAIYAVGLEWESPSELERFAKEHELRVPVLRGDDELRRAYRVDTFPTVYVIDERGAVQDRVVGYTTELGLRLRSL